MDLMSAASAAADRRRGAVPWVRRTAFLAEAGLILGSSLDHLEILRGLARLAVPRLADWCGVEEA